MAKTIRTDAGKTIQDLTGQTFALLTAISPVMRGTRTCWLCRCECGKEAVASPSDLTRGHTKSCGCLHRRRASEANSTHGLSRSPEYLSWCNMLARCTRKHHPRYHDYGDRGITVCERWLSFENFLSDMGRKPTPRHTVERNNNDKGYEPGNCRWATKAEQNRNTRTNRRITFNGETLNLCEWAKRTGIGYRVLSARLRNGWSVAEALTAPISASNKIVRIRQAGFDDQPLSFGGITRSVAEWAQVAGIQLPTLRARLRAGWPVEDALTKPVRKLSGTK